MAPATVPCVCCGLRTRLRCAGCETVSFCSGACAKEKWKAHKGSCRRIRRSAPATLGAAIERCVVCEARIPRPSTAMTLRCGHTFHKECAGRWFLTHGTCPACEALERYVRVFYRGIPLDVELAVLIDMDVMTAILHALALFSERFSLFALLHPPLLAEATASWPLGKKALPLGTSVALLETVLEAARASGATVAAVVEITASVPRHPHATPIGDFQFAKLIMAGRPPFVDRDNLKMDWPAACHDYYSRSADWVEVSAHEHRIGLCGIGRRERVVWMEAELAHDYADETLRDDDDAWAARRPLYVELHQAIEACREEARGSDADDDDDDFVYGTYITPPPGREHEDDAIRTEAACDWPVHMYGCPVNMEANSLGFYLVKLMKAAGVAGLEKYDSEDEADSHELFSDAELCSQVSFDSEDEDFGLRAYYELVTTSDDRVWSLVYWNGDAPPGGFLESLLVNFRLCKPDGGSNSMYIVAFNPTHPEYAKLPSMAPDERAFTLPYASGGS